MRLGPNLHKSIVFAFLDKILRVGNQHFVWVRPGRKTCFQKTNRPFAVLSEQWQVMRNFAQKRELLAYAARRSTISEALATRNLPRVPVDPSEVMITSACHRHHDPSA